MLRFGRWFSRASSDLRVDGGANTFDRLPADAGFEDVGQPGQLLAPQASVHADANVGHQLGFHPRHGGQHADGSQLAALLVQIVALEDVAEEVGAQVRKDP